MGDKRILHTNVEFSFLNSAVIIRESLNKFVKERFTKIHEYRIYHSNEYFKYLHEAG